MRRTSLMLLVSLLILVLIPAQAAQTDDALVSPLEIVPADMHIALSIETGDSARASLDSLIRRIAGWSAALGQPQTDIPTVSDLLAGSHPVNQGDVSAWLGDYVVSATGLPRDTVPTAALNLVAVHVRDRAAAEVSLAGWSFAPDGEGNGWSYYRIIGDGGGYILLRDDLLLHVSNHTEAEIARLKSGDYPRLTADARFVAALGHLPDSGYGTLIYFSGGGQEGSVTNGEPIIAGGKLIDDETFSIDIAVPAPDHADSRPLNPAFMAYIPADATAVAHITNLSATIGELMATARAAAESTESGQRDLAQAMQGLSIVGLNPDTLQTWTEGDLALFARVDALALSEMALGGDYAGFEAAIQLGVVSETSSPSDSARLARNLISLIRAGLQNAPDITVSSSDETIADTTVTVLTITPDATRPDLSLRLASASNDAIFVFGTYQAVRAALTQAGGFTDSALAQQTAPYLLPDASAVWRLDGANLGSMVVGYSAYVVTPTSAAVFAEISSPDGTVTRTETPVTLTPPVGPSPEDLRKAWEAAQEFIQHATISTATRDGVLYLRATITLGE